MKFETGLENSMVKTDNSFGFEELKSNIWQNNPRRLIALGRVK